MAFSLYYTARRDRALTPDEQTLLHSIADRYCAAYPFKRKTEDFGIYAGNDDPAVIFSGATKLPHSGYKTLYEVAGYWLQCLTEITQLLTGCEWEASFDDVSLIWDTREGWRFPTDEEYRQQTENR